MSNVIPLRTARRSLNLCQSCRNRPHNVQSPAGPPLSPAQRRGIGRAHIRKIKNAEEEWRQRADDIKSGSMKSMLALLEERGFINQIVGSRPDLDFLLTHRRTGIYAGVDPTGPSLHVGHMVPFMALSWFYLRGYPVHFLLGGFTARFGDPTGRLTDRKALSAPERKANIASMHDQLKRLGASIQRYAENRGYQKEWASRRHLENNAVWWSKVAMREFLAQLGMHIRLGPMLGRDTVKNKLESGSGMSFAEFTYPLLQAWDWWHLYQKGVQVQIGGADQFGNILAGAEAVKEIAKHSHEVQVDLTHAERLDDLYGTKIPSDTFGLTTPLLTTASGEKFGKSAGNAVWLDPTMTSPFELYQFFVRSADADVEKYLKLLTFLPLPEIRDVMLEHEKDQSRRVAQHKLAKEFVELIYGVDVANQTEASHRQLYNKTVSLKDLTGDATGTDPTQQPRGEIHPLLNKHAAPLNREDSTKTRISLPRSLVIEKPLSHILWACGLSSSKSEGQRLINAGGVYIGGLHNSGGMEDSLSYSPARTSHWNHLSQFVLDEKTLILRSGKWRVKIINIVPDEEYAATGQTCDAWEEFKATKATAREQEKPE